MATLVLLRHADAEPHRTDDHGRRLSTRGRADAAAAREVLDRLAPDRAVVSTAARAVETWQLAGTVPPVLDGRVYEASVADLREVVAETPAEVGTLVLVGHNPGVEQLAWELDDGEAARELTDRGLPTCAVAVFDVASWDLEQARLVELVVPRA